MGTEVHPTALVETGAELGQDVRVLPYTIIEAGTVIGDRSVIGPHAVVRRWTTLGADSHISTGAVLGEPPQDRKYAGEETYLRVGSGNEIREYVTLHRATGEGESTIIGDNNMIMAYSHAGHNVVIGSNCQIANAVQIAGHCHINSFVNIGGMTGLHQFVTIGEMAMVGAMSRITRDCPPFCITEGIPAEIRGLNVIGLERRGVSPEVRVLLRQAFRLLFRSEYNTSEALQAVADQIEPAEQVLRLCDFVRLTAEGNMGRQLARR